MKTIKAEVIFKTSSFFNLVNSNTLLEIKSILNAAFLHLIVSESHHMTLLSHLDFLFLHNNVEFFTAESFKERFRKTDV